MAFSLKAVTQPMLFISLAYFFSLAHCYQIDVSCGQYVQDIKDAFEEAKIMAKYAAWRVNAREPVDQSEIVIDLLGRPITQARQMFAAKMSLVEPYVGPYRGQWNPASPMSEPSGIVIKCDDVHLRPAQGYDGSGNLVDVWTDPEFPGSNTPAESNIKPCHERSNGDYPAAMEYWTSNIPGRGEGPISVIMLCGTGDHSALELNNDAGVTRSAAMRANWDNYEWDDFSVDYATTHFMSRVVLHEIMHVMRHPPVCRATLPSSTTQEMVPEIYGWSNIAAHRVDADKPYNADSYAILATVYWLKNNRYDRNGYMGERYTYAERRMLQMVPTDPHP